VEVGAVAWSEVVLGGESKDLYEITVLGLKKRMENYVDYHY